MARAALYGFGRGEVALEVGCIGPFLVLLHFEHRRFEHGETGGADFDRRSRRNTDRFNLRARGCGTLRFDLRRRREVSGGRCG